MILTLQIGRAQGVLVRSLEEASAEYAKQRDASGEGASTFHNGVVRNAAGHTIAHVSYNAKVWDKPNGELLYNPYAKG